MSMTKKVDPTVLERELQALDPLELRKNGVYLDRSTFATSFKLTDTLKQLLHQEEDFWEDEDDTVCEDVICEYQLDTQKVFYRLDFSYESIGITEALRCPFLDNLVKASAY